MMNAETAGAEALFVIDIDIFEATWNRDLHDGYVPQRALVDTGASCSYMSQKVADSFPCWQVKNCLPFDTLAANNTPIFRINQKAWDVKIRLNTHDWNGPSHAHVSLQNFSITNYIHSKYELVLGMDFLREHQPHLQYITNRLEFNADKCTKCNESTASHHYYESHIGHESLVVISDDDEDDDDDDNNNHRRRLSIGPSTPANFKRSRRDPRA